MVRYEFTDGSSAKFWEPDVEGSTFIVRYGRIGTKGQESRKDCASPEAAAKEMAKKVKEKLKEGYVLVGGAEGGAVHEAGPPAARGETAAVALQRLDRWLQEHPNPWYSGVLFAGPIDEKQLAAAERQLKCPLPAGYVRLMREQGPAQLDCLTGDGHLGAYEILAPAGFAEAWDLLFENSADAEADAEEAGRDFHHMVVFQFFQDGDGSGYVFRTSDPRPGPEYPIYVKLDDEVEASYLAASFDEHIVRFVDRMIEEVRVRLAEAQAKAVPGGETISKEEFAALAEDELEVDEGDQRTLNGCGRSAIQRVQGSLRCPTLTLDDRRALLVAGDLEVEGLLEVSSSNLLIVQGEIRARDLLLQGTIRCGGDLTCSGHAIIGGHLGPQVTALGLQADCLIYQRGRVQIRAPIEARVSIDVTGGYAPFRATHGAAEIAQTLVPEALESAASDPSYWIILLWRRLKAGQPLLKPAGTPEAPAADRLLQLFEGEEQALLELIKRCAQETAIFSALGAMDDATCTAALAIIARRRSVMAASLLRTVLGYYWKGGDAGARMLLLSDLVADWTPEGDGPLHLAYLHAEAAFRAWQAGDTQGMGRVYRRALAQVPSAPHPLWPFQGNAAATGVLKAELGADLPGPR